METNKDKSKKLPYFKFYPSDFIIGTIHMSEEEIGAYAKLLCYQWLKDGVKVEDLDRLVNNKSENVLDKFKEVDGKLFNDRLVKERNLYNQKCEQNRLNVLTRYERSTSVVPSNYNGIPSQKSEVRSQNTEARSQKLDLKALIVEIINYLNDVCKKEFKTTTQKTISLINARIKEGFTLKNFKDVIDGKAKDWLLDENMNQYLRPETLLGTKFEGYLNENKKPGFGDCLDDMEFNKEGEFIDV